MATQAHAPGVNGPAARFEAVRRLSLDIAAPLSDDPALATLVGSLRSAGEIVMQLLPGQTDHGPDQHIDRMIELEDGRWQVRDRTARDEK